MSVYLIRCGESGPVKIGKADDVPNRMWKLQAGNHEILVLLRTLDGGRQTESWLHRHFGRLHIRAEWYAFDPEMLVIVPPGETVGRHKSYDAPLKQVFQNVGPTELARSLKVTPSAVTNWERIPARHLPRIEHLTGIPGRELRPDLYPNEAAA
jgi:hypothetical protein